MSRRPSISTEFPARKGNPIFARWLTAWGVGILFTIAYLDASCSANALEELAELKHQATATERSAHDTISSDTDSPDTDSTGTASSETDSSGNISTSPQFDREVMAVFARAGCNQGTCHGNQNGKGGFYLSLRGEDPAFDYSQLTEQYEGRRLNVFEPEESLLLLKATAEVAHRGGKRFAKNSPEYALIEAWLEQGAPRETQTAPVIELTVTPAVVTLSTQQSADLKVTAKFADGTETDVTDLAVYTATEAAVTVSDMGNVSAEKVGESSILVWFLQQQTAIDVAVVPSTNETNDIAIPASSPHEIDRLLGEKHNRLKMIASPLCDDTTFVRRAHLDLLGRIPTTEEARGFIDSTSQNKRAELIDRLLDNPQFADYWALKWSDLLRNEEKVLDQRGVTEFYNWIRQTIIDDVPLDEFAKSLVSSRGSTYENPPANFYRALRDPMERGEAAARLLLGVRLQCAKCHNHPFESWTQDDYYHWAAVFATVDYEIVENKRRDDLDKHEFKGEQIVKLNPEAKMNHPRTGQPVEPRFLGASEMVTEGETEKDRLLQLADWLSTDARRRYAKVQANLVWYHLMGRGIVDPIDDFRATNRPSNGPLLEWLTDQLIEGQFDLKQLVRKVMLSHAYQRDSKPNATNQYDDRNHSFVALRRIPAESLLDSQNQVLGVSASFAHFPDAGRAVALPGAELPRSPKDGDRFLRKFGKPTRLLGCECERSNETTLSQAFELISGKGLQKRLTKNDNQLAQWDKEGLETSEIITGLYWSALSRGPTEAEQAGAKQLIATARSKREGIEDLAWALLNSKEFIFRR